MNVRQLVAMLAVAVSPLSAQQPRVAVAPFETEGSVGMPREDFDALGRALGAILTTEMAERRGGAASAIAAPAAGRGGRIDLAVARDRATKAGGTLLVIGTLLDQYGDINVEARVIDAATGQNGLNQALEFNEALGLDGIIMTKLDGTAKGGIAMAVAERLKLPILRVGVGEQVDDLQEFNAKDFCRALVGESN